jgi:hypothetical protein
VQRAEVMTIVHGLFALPAVVALVVFGPRAGEIAFGALLLLVAGCAGVKVVRGRLDDPLQRWRTAWVAAFCGVAGSALLACDFRTALLLALAFVGASFLALTAFILNLLLGEEPPVLRLLLIALFCIGLVVEVCGLIGTFGLRW